MTLVLLVAVLALTAVVAAGGGARLAAIRLRAVRLLVAAAVLHLGTALLAPDSGWARSTTLVLATLLVALFLFGNRALPGVPLAALGLLLNVVVVTANGAMPVSAEAATRAGASAPSLRLDSDPMREPLGPDTRLGLLADRIPVASPWRPQAVSAGDVLVAAGVALLLLSAPRRRRPAQLPRRPARPTAFARESTTRGSYS
ncbi:MAG: DUF5317 family protein [Actinomycetes bacterium]